MLSALLSNHNENKICILFKFSSSIFSTLQIYVQRSLFEILYIFFKTRISKYRLLRRGRAQKFNLKVQFSVFCLRGPPLSTRVR